RQMLDFLGEIGVPTVVVLTKIDKLTANQRARRVEEISAMLGLDQDQVVPFSAVSGEGRNELAEAIDALLAQPSWRAAPGSGQRASSRRSRSSRVRAAIRRPTQPLQRRQRARGSIRRRRRSCQRASARFAKTTSPSCSRAKAFGSPLFRSTNRSSGCSRPTR